VLENNVIIAGYSGHAYVVADSAISAGFNLIGYTSKSESKINPFNLKYCGNERDSQFFDNFSAEFILGIGDNLLRAIVLEFLIDNNIKVLNVIDNSSVLSKQVELGIGIFISKNVTINPLVSIGDGCIVNTSSVVEHECKIGNNSHIGPGAVLCGGVTIGNKSFVGANTVIKQGVNIGNNVIIGAGSVVINDIRDNIKVVGNPHREIK
tara:strand:+ start:2667 stop:3290 length:624 start_codon:yes stop_codon:yes gene_type:complete